MIARNAGRSSGPIEFTRHRPRSEAQHQSLWDRLEPGSNAAKGNVRRSRHRIAAMVKF